jgi:hypothetical protein
VAYTCISATQETEGGRYSKLARAKSQWDPILLDQPGMVVQACDSSYEGGVNRITVQVGPGQKHPIQKITKAKRAEGVIQMVERACLASTRPWVQTPRTTKGKEKRSGNNLSVQVYRNSQRKLAHKKFVICDMYGTEVHYIMWNKPTLENKYCMIHSYMAYKKIWSHWR